MQSILDAINEWIKEILIGAINGNLSTMFGDVNEKVGTIANEVGQTPQGWNANIFSMIQTLSENGNTFILGRKYLGLERYFHKEIARVQAQWYGQQSGKGVKHPVTSKHIRKLYKRKQDSVTDYLHKVTRYLAEYCREQGITCFIPN